MDLHSGQRDSFERIHDADAGVRVGGWVDDDSVKLAKGLLNPVDNDALVVALADVNSDIQLFSDLLDEGDQVRIGLSSVDVGFTDAQHIEVWTVDEKNLCHGLNAFYDCVRQ